MNPFNHNTLRQRGARGGGREGERERGKEGERERVRERDLVGDVGIPEH